MKKIRNRLIKYDLENFVKSMYNVHYICTYGMSSVINHRRVFLQKLCEINFFANTVWKSRVVKSTSLCTYWRSRFLRKINIFSVKSTSLLKKLLYLAKELNSRIFLTQGKRYQLIPRSANFLWLPNPYTNSWQTSKIILGLRFFHVP